MDLTLFRIDFEVLSEVLIVIIILAFVLEHALSLILERHRHIGARSGTLGFVRTTCHSSARVTVSPAARFGSN